MFPTINLFSIKYQVKFLFGCYYCLRNSRFHSGWKQNYNNWFCEKKSSLNPKVTSLFAGYKPKSDSHKLRGFPTAEVGLQTYVDSSTDAHVI